MPRFLLLLCCLFVLACQSADSTDQGGFTPSFFPVKTYFSTALADYQAGGLARTKQLVYGDTTEEKALDTAALRQDFQLFIENDINRPAWTDVYRADTTIVDGQITRTSYTALKENLRTRAITVDWEAGAVKQIEIVSELNTLIADQQRKLTFWPDSAYQIEHQQEGRGLSTLAYKMVVELKQ